MKAKLVPLGIFLVLAVFLGVGLTLNPRLLPSPLIGKSMPEFSLEKLDDAAQLVQSPQIFTEPALLNVWASWCGACRQEHPLLMSLAEKTDVPIIGINYKDQRTDAQGWLARYGNPYRFSVYDHRGKAGIDLGVYGVPETFVVDGRGIIQYKHVGPVTEAVLNEHILPLIASLRGGK